MVMHAYQQSCKGAENTVMVCTLQAAQVKCNALHPRGKPCN